MRGLKPSLIKELQASAEFTVRDVGTQSMTNPAVRTRAAEHFTDKRQLPFTDEFICTVNASGFVQDEIPEDVKSLSLPLNTGNCVRK